MGLLLFSQTRAIQLEAHEPNLAPNGFQWCTPGLFD